jgi:hypothetical protein
MCSRTPGRRRARVVVPVLVAMLAPVAAARAAAPVDLMPPAVFGEPVAGRTLVGFPGVWSSDGALELDPQWRRCPPAGLCTDIPGAASLAYAVAPDDAGQRILLRVTARSRGGTVVRDSEPTAPVPGAAPARGEPPDARPPPVPATAAAPVERRASWVEPFPEVRIRGAFTLRWTRFTRVTVRAPAGAAIAIECGGRGCPFRSRARTMTARKRVRLTGLERRFRPGTAILLRVTQPGRIGKATRIWTRRGRRPGRWDGCVVPGSPEPVACPLA